MLPVVSLRMFPSLPGSRLAIFYREASSALLQLVNQRLSFTYSRSHAFYLQAHVLTLPATDARIKILLDENRTPDFFTSRYACL